MPQAPFARRGRMLSTRPPENGALPAGANDAKGLSLSETDWPLRRAKRARVRVAREKRPFRDNTPGPGIERR